MATGAVLSVASVSLERDPVDAFRLEDGRKDPSSGGRGEGDDKRNDEAGRSSCFDVEEVELRVATVYGDHLGNKAAGIRQPDIVWEAQHCRYCFPLASCVQGPERSG